MPFSDSHPLLRKTVQTAFSGCLHGFRGIGQDYLKIPSNLLFQNLIFTHIFAGTEAGATISFFLNWNC